uniref:Ubiquinone biosynthesis protein COQ4 homolog, mitochondrial n=2 Tax=Spongospora subterranea TaxID=70186 RepID=A0A0H5R8A4_9EUKA|eukprot:CRZ04554.1 hypothetical protein [Spongospora subterranea]
MAVRRSLPKGIPLTAGQKIFLTAGSALFGVLDTYRGDLIATLSETTTPSLLLRSLHARMNMSISGRRLMQERPTIDPTTLNLEELSGLPSNTFGYAYYKFMSSHGYSSEDRTPVRFITDPDHAFLIQRYRQTHDFLHCLSDLPPNLLGEISLKWFELLQLGLPMCAITGIGGSLRLSFSQKRDLVTKFIPWAVRCHRSSEFLLSVYFEEHLEKDLDCFRLELGFIKAPS